MHKVFGILVTSIWLTAMGWLVACEVWPRLTAQDPPTVVSRAQGDRNRGTQVGIFDAQNRRVGRAWSVLSPSGEQFHMEGTVVLTDLSALPPVRIETVLTLMGDGSLDEFEMSLYGVRDLRGKPLKINMHGECYGRYVPCTLQVGTFRRTFKLDAAATRLVSDGIRPFDVLRDLKVGQSWRMQMLDPFSAVLGQKANIDSVIARVERKETITHEKQAVECFLVTVGRGRAWVASDGRVLVQEVDVPGLGRLSIRDEKYDPDARGDARKAVAASD